MDIQLPPARYDRPAIIQIVDATDVWDVMAKCRAHGESHAVLACTKWETIGKVPCVIVIPVVGFKTTNQPVTAEDRARMIRHERGHCNGWPADHPK
jgi:hypothetical protein